LIGKGVREGERGKRGGKGQERRKGYSEGERIRREREKERGWGEGDSIGRRERGNERGEREG
jgi:hypothetical protein